VQQTNIDGKLIGIYLNDHLSGSIVGIELAKRSARNNEGTPLGAFLHRLVAEIEQDKAVLERVMDHLGISQDPLKKAAGWTAEKIGRGKLNGQLTGYSDLSRLEELEGLSVGIEGKRLLWQSLEATTVVPAIPGIDIPEMIDRAERQRVDLETHRRAAAAIALTP
jgi:hypothetical protein